MLPGCHGKPSFRIVVVCVGEPRLHSARAASGVHRPPPQGGDGGTDMFAHFAAGGELVLRGGERSRQLPHFRRGALVAPWVSRPSLAATHRLSSHPWALARRAPSLVALGAACAIACCAAWLVARPRLRRIYCPARVFKRRRACISAPLQRLTSLRDTHPLFYMYTHSGTLQRRRSLRRFTNSYNLASPSPSHSLPGSQS